MKTGANNLIGRIAAKWALPALAFCVLQRPLRVAAEGTWTPLSSTAPSGILTMLLLTDGTVMGQAGGGAGWYHLIPGSSGGYSNGYWTNDIVSMHYNRLYYSSQVLPDGRVFVAGAEYGNGTTNAEIYDPVNNNWTIPSIPNGIINKNNTIDSQGANSGGFVDSASALLSNGSVLVTPVSPYYSGEATAYSPGANFWATNYLYSGGNEDEACLVMLADNSILVVNAFATTSERYIPSSNQWVDDSTVPVTLFDSYGGECGPAFLLPNGKAFYIGSTPHSALYTPTGTTSPGTWQAGPNIPGNLGAPDAPAAMMNNGKILCALSPTPYNLGGTNYVFTTPSYFYEYDYSSGSIGAFTQIHAPGGGYTRNEVTYGDRMLVLPDGGVLFTDGGTQLYEYTPDGSPLVAGQPSIYSYSWNADGSIHLTGTLFNGISAGAAYGDDAQENSNYPIVRFSSGGSVYYGRTYNWTPAVATGGNVVSTDVTVPPAVFDFPGTFSMQVIANGNASAAVTFFSPVWVDFNYSGTFQFGWFQFPYSTIEQGTNAVTSGGTVAIEANIQPSHTTDTMTISKPMTIISVYGPSTIGH